MSERVQRLAFVGDLHRAVRALDDAERADAAAWLGSRRDGQWMPGRQAGRARADELPGVLTREVVERQALRVDEHGAVDG